MKTLFLEVIQNLASCNAQTMTQKIWGKIWAKILRTPKNMRAHTPMNLSAAIVVNAAVALETECSGALC